MNTIVGGGTGPVATGIVGVSGTRSLNIGYLILETAVGGDASDAVDVTSQLGTLDIIEIELAWLVLRIFKVPRKQLV